jgi:hypothetical protein
LFAQSSYNTRVRSLLDRRREMLAWETAVAINTAASFDAFLVNYASSDLAATARKMQERVRNRSLGANTALLQPTNVALGPTCPCTTPPPTPPVLKKVEPARPTRRVDRTPPKHRRPQVYDEEDVVVEQAGAPAGYVPPGAVVGGGIGFGGGYGGGFGGGFGGRGGGGRR